MSVAYSERRVGLSYCVDGSIPNERCYEKTYAASGAVLGKRIRVSNKDIFLSPNGRYVAWNNLVASIGGTSKIRVKAPPGGQPQGWSSDGKYLYYIVPATLNNDNGRLWRAPADGSGSPTKLAFPRSLASYAVRPRGGNQAVWTYETSKKVSQFAPAEISAPDGSKAKRLSCTAFAWATPNLLLAYRPHSGDPVLFNRRCKVVFSGTHRTYRFGAMSGMDLN